MEPSNIIVPPVVTFIVEELTTPVIGPVNAVALTVPDTSNFVVGVELPIPILLALASMYIAVTLVPPSLTLKADAKTLKEISTGKKENKFGVNEKTFLELVNYI